MLQHVQGLDKSKNDTYPPDGCVKIAGGIRLSVDEGSSSGTKGRAIRSGRRLHGLRLQMTITLKGKRTTAIPPIATPTTIDTLLCRGRTEVDGCGCVVIEEGKTTLAVNADLTEEEDVGKGYVESEVDRRLSLNGGEEVAVIVVIESEGVRESEETDVIIQSGLRRN